MRILAIAVALLLSLFACPALAAEKMIGVFVALADIKNQGIGPVPAAIGNGEDPERNLYWGNSEGLQGWFDHSRRWRRVAKSDVPAKGDILRTRTYRYVSGGVALVARAYRGSAMKTCLADFEAAVQDGSYDLVVFIGHNGLMDFRLPQPTRLSKQVRHPDCVVLCCKSESYFKTRLTNAGGHPILLTTQLMYPGSFLLDAIVDPWRTGAKLTEIRADAGAAYAKNQKISRRSGTGVFADLKN